MSDTVFVNFVKFHFGDLDVTGKSPETEVSEMKAFPDSQAGCESACAIHGLAMSALQTYRISEVVHSFLALELKV